MANIDNTRDWEPKDSRNDTMVPERPVPAEKVVADDVKTFDHIPGLNYRPGQRN